MAALLGELHDLSESLRETVLTFREYTVKHDTLKESNVKLWAKYESIENKVQAIEIINASNQQVINSVIQIKNKALVIVVTAIMSPIAVGAAILFK